jgi:hypothetical protein
MNSKLQIGIILNPGDLSLWIYRVIEKIIHTGYSDIVLVIFNTETTGIEKSGESLLYRLHLKTDRFISRNRIDFDRAVDASGLLQGIPTIAYPDAASGNSSLKEISKYKLDILLNFTSKKPAQTELPLARYGIWSYQTEPQDPYKRPSNGYWELIKKTPERMVVVKSTDTNPLTENILFRSCIPASLYSIHLNLDRACNLCSLFIPRILKGIYEKGPGYLTSLIERSPLSANKQNQDVPRSPSNIQAAWNMLAVYFTYACNKVLYLERQKWFVAYKQEKDPLINGSGNYTSLIPTGDRFWADPFVICRDKKAYVFIEELLFATNKGHISVLELDDQGKHTGAAKILEKDYHMSYPFLFEYNHQYYMIPETSENKTIQLYQCERFPDRWKFVMNLKENIAALDTTVFFYNNKWWLFTAVNESSHFPEFLELFLYYSDDIITSNWTPHPANPIVSDIRSARPAGRIFINNHKIYRPSQDCSGLYGKACNMNQITTLSETAFEEILISKTEADWDPKLKGTHTFNFDEDILVTDAFTVDKRFHKAS